MKQTKYVAGFLLSLDLKNVVLVQKNRPQWQAGLLNAVGGHIEEYDANPHAAMVREFAEETGNVIPKWRYYAQIAKKDQFIVEFFCATGILNTKTVTDEEIIILPVVKITTIKTIENIPWLLYLAIDHLTDKGPSFAGITY